MTNGNTTMKVMKSMKLMGDDTPNEIASVLQPRLTDPYFIPSLFMTFMFFMVAQ